MRLSTVKHKFATLAACAFIAEILFASSLWADTSLVFPQFADGQGYVSVVLLTNRGSVPTVTTLRFTGSSGAPQPVTIQGTAASSFTVSLQPGASTKLATSGLSPGIVTGWVEVETTPPVEIDGALVYQLSAGGKLSTEATVPAAQRSTRSSFFVDLESGFNSGVAISNPGLQHASVQLTTRNSLGQITGSLGITLGPRQQLAAFVPQLIPTATSGRAEITSSSPVSAVALRISPTTTLTTLPVTTESLSMDTVVASRFGVGTTPMEAVDIRDGNIRIRSTGERQLELVRDDLPRHPAFRIGRIVIAGDGRPEIRILALDDNTPEHSIFECDDEGKCATVKPRGLKGAFWESFNDGDFQPQFRFNNFPTQQLELGPGGNAQTDVKLRRPAANTLSVVTGPFDSETERMRIDSQGMTVLGRVVSSGGFEVASSRSIKQDVAPLEGANALEKLLSLNPVTFRYTADSTRETQVGFIAEDTSEMIANRDHSGILVMNLVAILTKVVQQQQAEISALKQRVQP